MVKDMKKVFVVMFLVVLCALVAGCSFGDPVKDSSQTADIKVKNGVFDVNAKTCIRMLNEDLEKANLAPIPEKYIKETEEIEVNSSDHSKVRTTYTYQITGTLQLQLYSFKELDNGIPAIGVIASGKQELSKGDESLLREYFKIICNHVEPRFDVDRFNDPPQFNEEYELGELYFWFGRFNTQEENDSEKVEQVYLVTTNQDLFDFYM